MFDRTLCDKTMAFCQTDSTMLTTLLLLQSTAFLLTGMARAAAKL